MQHYRRRCLCRAGLFSRAAERRRTELYRETRQQRMAAATPRQDRFLHPADLLLQRHQLDALVQLPARAHPERAMRQCSEQLVCFRGHCVSIRDAYALPCAGTTRSALLGLMLESSAASTCEFHYPYTWQSGRLQS